MPSELSKNLNEFISLVVALDEHLKQAAEIIADEDADDFDPTAGLENLVKETNQRAIGLGLASKDIPMIEFGDVWKYLNEEDNQRMRDGDPNRSKFTHGVMLAYLDHVQAGENLWPAHLVISCFNGEDFWNPEIQKSDLLNFCTVLADWRREAKRRLDEIRDDYRPATWFTDKTEKIDERRLRRARTDGRLKHFIKQHGRYLHSVSEVAELWPAEMAGVSVD